MQIDELKIGELKELIQLLGSGQNQADPGPWVVGAKYLIRTCTHYSCGRLVGVWPQELLLDDAAWIPDTGRYCEALENGVFNEVEPVYKGKDIIGRGSIVDAQPWYHGIDWKRK